MQIMELPADGAEGVAHPYFLAAQFHPELTGRPLRPQPMFMGLIAAAIRRKYPDAELPERWVRVPGAGGKLDAHASESR
jgi:CTP synthase